MTAREFLDQYRIAYNRADRLKEKLDVIRSDYDAVHGGIVFVPCGSEISKPTERKIEKLQKTFDKWAAAQLHSVEIRQEIFEVISSLDDCKMSDILWFRYLGLLTWDEVCDAVGLSWCTVHRLHKQAVELIDQLIN